MKLLVLTESRGTSTPPVNAAFGIVTADLKMGNRWKSELSPLGGPTVSAAAVPPGRYELRIGASDGTGRRGTVTHAFTAQLTDAGPFKLSDLVLGEAANGSFRPRLSFSGLSFIVGYVEVYGTAPGSVSLTLERADSVDSPALDSRPMALRSRPGADWRFAEAGMSVSGVSRDQVIRAVVRVDGVVVGRVSRTLRVE